MRFAVDTGGTFTDLVVEGDGGQIRMYKAATTPKSPVEGVLSTLKLAALDYGLELAAFLAQANVFIYGTTHATNAIVTGATAKTAFLTTKGHKDILVIREGGKIEPFNFTVPYPKSYVPRALTFEISERILYDGIVHAPLDIPKTLKTIERLKAENVEAVAVCLLWAIVNPCHELKIGDLLDRYLPGVPVTLSHLVNPCLREYRRASSACIDASLKPLMGAHLRELDSRLREAGFGGTILTVTSQGGVMEAADLANVPIHSVKSGPAMAPIAGRFYAEVDTGLETAIVADTGGTTFDISLVRKNRIPWTRETWIGQPYRGYMTGFPSVDVKSIGAGGGSIAWVDDGGLLHVGPQSAGAVPGPAAYNQGGSEPTVTDAAVVAGYIDPDYFLGGRMALDKDAAAHAIETGIAQKLGLDLYGAAVAVISVMTENMVRAIEEITVNQGIDPRGSVLVGGGGAAGLNAGALARRLRCAVATIPDVAAALSAAGALMSDLRTEHSATCFASSGSFDFDKVNSVLADLERQCQAFISGPGARSHEQAIEYTAEARYPFQIWEIEVPLRTARFDSAADVERLVEDFHSMHQDIFAIADHGSPIEVVAWRANVRCRLRERGAAWSMIEPTGGTSLSAQRTAYFSKFGRVDAQVLAFEMMERNATVKGPAIIESSFTSIVVEPGAIAERKNSGSLVIRPAG